MKNYFASVGGDGSLRFFDTRSLDTSTILYETSDRSALVRLDWNYLDTNLIAIFQQDSMTCQIIDIRNPSVGLISLSGHTGCLNGISWTPLSPHHICSVADDHLAFIWDISNHYQGKGPVLAFDAESEINSVSWSHSNYLAITSSNILQILQM